MKRSWKSRVGVLALTATMGVGLVGLASPAGAAGNSDNAKACQKGGFVNQATTSGARFKNAGECTSYAANGGTLVPLPDLVPEVTCTDDGHQLRCTFNVRNIGAAPTTTSPFVTVVDFSSTTTHTIITISVNPGALAPGQSGSDRFTITFTAVQGTLTATADPDNVVVEGNESNNVFSRSFSLT